MTTRKARQRIGSVLVYFYVMFSSDSRVYGDDTIVNAVIPPSLIRPNGYIHQSAGFEFAKCPFNRLSGTCRWNAPLYAIENSFCDQNDYQNEIAVPNEPFLVVVGRSDCFFDVQAQNAQQFGAIGVLIVDHTCLCSAGSTCVSSNPCVDEPPLLNTASIPSILLQKQDGEAIQSALASERVRMQVDWEVSPQFTETVDIHFWHVPSPYRSGGQDMQSSWGRAFEQMASDVSFTPKFALQSGDDIGCHPDNPTTEASICQDRCTNNGRYCAEDPEGALFEGVSGMQVVEEVVRRMCIFEDFGRNRTDSVGRQYWEYLKFFSDACKTDNHGGGSYNELWADDSCSQRAMETAGIDYLRVMRCVIQSGGTTGNYPNQNLEEALTEQPQRLQPPSLGVNSIQYRGQTFSEVLGAICFSYSSDSVPSYCTSCLNCVEEFNCVIDGGFCSEQRPLETFAPTIAPLSAQPSPDPSVEQSFPGATSRPVTEDPVSIDDGAFPAENYTNSSFPSGDGEGDVSIADPTQGQGQSSSSEDGDSGGGLSDTMKVVIVVAVVGGAILVIFSFVIFLVYQLLHRIKNLEKNDNKTPTTTSPAGSNIWDLPHYTGKEDPFNSECDPIPPEVIEMSLQSVPDPVPQEVLDMSIETSASAPAAPTPTRDLETGPLVEPNRGVLVPESNIQVSGPTQPTSSTDENFRDATPVHAAVPLIADKKNASSKRIDKPKSPKKSSSGDRRSSPNKQREKPKTPKKVSSLQSPNRSKTKPKRTSQNGPTLVDLMGKAPPEEKVPKRFSYEDEEKEEIADDWQGIYPEIFLDGAMDKID